MLLRIHIVTPGALGKSSGNRTTAVRWGRILDDLGHKVSIDGEWNGQQVDLLIAIHAWRSADAIERFKAAHPERPLIVTLAGTDVYEFQTRDPQRVHRSMALADRLVGLHDRVSADIPARFASKIAIVLQSVEPHAAPRSVARDRFDICVVAHLRDIKDPLRAAHACALLAPDSRVRVQLVGRAEEASWIERIDAQRRGNARFCYRGELCASEVRAVLRDAHCMVISSLNEGGANVVSEAIVAGCPIMASRVSGNIGLLGEDYDGYFDAANTDQLAALMARAERQPEFLAALERQIQALRPRFLPSAESAAWRDLLASLKRRR